MSRFVCQHVSVHKTRIVQEFKPDQMKWNQHKASINIPSLCEMFFACKRAENVLICLTLAKAILPASKFLTASCQTRPDLVLQKLTEIHTS